MAWGATSYKRADNRIPHPPVSPRMVGALDSLQKPMTPYLSPATVFSALWLTGVLVRARRPSLPCPPSSFALLRSRQHMSAVIADEAQMITNM
eukprot:6198621-Pleurochrysis_carterae.AAC.1